MDAADAAGIESLKMMKKWNVTYDKYKNKLHYGCLKHYYKNDKTTPIHCGFRILHSSEHMNQDVILPSEFAIYMVSVHKKITGDREQRKQQLRDAVESCVGKPDKYGIYNACLLDLSGPDVKGMRWTEELPKDACIGPLVLGDDFFSFKVFSSFSPMGTKVNTDSRGNVTVTFFDYMGEAIARLPSQTFHTSPFPYGDKKNRWNYNGIGDHYMCKLTERITGGFRILAVGKHPEQRVIIPHQFAKFVGDVLIHAKGHYEHMKAMERIIEHCTGKPEGPLRSFNAMLLDLSPEQETALRAEYRQFDATSLGPLAVGDAYFDCKVFHTWDPEQTQGYRDDDGNVMVTFYDYDKNCIGKFLIARTLD